MAQKKTRPTFRNLIMSSEYASPARTETSLTISRESLQPETSRDSSTPLGMTKGAIRHLYVHIPFCARICPYCAFYKQLLDRSQTWRFCEALLRELDEKTGSLPLVPKTIYFGGGTPTTLTRSQLDFLLGGFRERLDLSALKEWTIEANPGSVSTRKAAILYTLGANRISLGVQSWDDKLLQLLGREHTAHQGEQSFHILRTAGFSNVNVDLMFGLPGQTIDQWRLTLERTIGLQ